MNRVRAVPASVQRYGLAEGPVWDPFRDRVLWVDINAGTVHAGRFREGAVTEELLLTLQETVSAVVPSAGGELLVAGARVVHSVSRDGVVSTGPRVIAEGKASRLNDGGCDPSGRLLVGSLALDDRVHEEVLVRIDDNGEVVVIDDDLGLSNGLAFTAAGDRLYSIDTEPGVVWARGYNANTGTFGHREEFLRITDGSPDGMCLDGDGNLWIAIWGAGQVRCFSPTGDQLAIVDVAAPNTTSVCFIGAKLDTLFITSAWEELTDEQLEHHPDSGRLFTAQVGVSGLSVPLWSGTQRETLAAPAGADSR